MYSEAMAGTRTRGDTKAFDLQIALDLLSSMKDDKKFTIVPEGIKRKLEVVCTTILVELEKTIRKVARVHLYARIRGRLRSEDDEVPWNNERPLDTKELNAISLVYVVTRLDIDN